MFPPPAVHGFVVPGGWMPWRQLRLGCHPPGLFDRLKTLPSFNPRELALDMALEEKTVEGCATRRVRSTGSRFTPAGRDAGSTSHGA